MKKFLAVLILVVLLIPVGSWWFSPAQVVKRRTKHLMAVLSISEDSLGSIRKAKTYSMNGLLAPYVTLDIPGTSEANGIFEKEAIESGFSWICENTKSSNFGVSEFRSLEINGNNATVNILVEGYMELFTMRPVDGLHDVTITWKKGGDGWRFNRVDWDTP